MAATGNRCFLPSFSSFGQTVSEEKNLKNQPMRNKSRLWWPCLLMDQEVLYKGYSFRPDPLTNMAATGNSGFGLDDVLDSSPLKPFGQMN
jgi:hypothetical protein